MTADIKPITHLLNLYAAQLSVDPLSVETSGPPPQLERELGALANVAVAARQTQGLLELAASAGLDALAGAAGSASGGGHFRVAPVNLRRDALAATDRWHQVRRPLHHALAAAVFMFAALTAALLWRGHQYSKFIAHCEEQQRQVFHELFPGRSVPLAVRAYLDSEFRGLQGISGQSSELPRQTSALLVLYEALRRLPLPGAELRYSLLELRFEGEEVYFDGQTRSHGDADAVAAALRTQGGFSVEPPRTERLRDEGVGFTLRAKAPVVTAVSPSVPVPQQPVPPSSATQPTTQPTPETGPPSSLATSVAERSQ